MNPPGGYGRAGCKNANQANTTITDTSSNLRSSGMRSRSRCWRASKACSMPSQPANSIDSEIAERPCRCNNRNPSLHRHQEEAAPYGHFLVVEIQTPRLLIDAELVQLILRDCPDSH